MASGALLARVELPANARGALMTYMVRAVHHRPGGRGQPPAGLVALTLP